MRTIATTLAGMILLVSISSADAANYAPSAYAKLKTAVKRAYKSTKDLAKTEFQDKGRVNTSTQKRLKVLKQAQTAIREAKFGSFMKWAGPGAVVLLGLAIVNAGDPITGTLTALGGMLLKKPANRVSAAGHADAIVASKRAGIEPAQSLTRFALDQRAPQVADAKQTLSEAKGKLDGLKADVAFLQGKPEKMVTVSVPARIP